MKFVSSMNMDECLTEEGVEKLSANLTSFINSHKVMDKKAFDDVSIKARNLGNKKLMEQCRVARSRCEETKQVLKVREATIVKAKEEIEAQKAKRISLEQLAADTNITPLTASSSKHSPDQDEDIWLPQTPSSDATCTQNKQLATNRRQSKTECLPGEDDTNNNSKETTKADQRVVTKCVHSRTRSEDTSMTMADLPSVSSTLTESLDTMASSSQEDMLSRDGSQSDMLNDSQNEKLHQVTPIIVPDELKENAMVKRRSFAGFTASTAFPSFNDLSKVTKPANDERLSTDMSELDEGLVPDSSSHSNTEISKSVVEKLEELGIDRTTCNKIASKKDPSLRDSVITGSSDSLTRYAGSTFTQRFSRVQNSQSIWLLVML